MSLKAVIDWSVCSGTSNCAEEAPEAYEVNDRGLAVFVAGRATDEAILAGARSCPVGAIRVVDQDGKQVYP